MYSTLYHLFKTRSDRVIYQEHPLDDLEKYQDYRKVIIVRDPERRLKSIYKDKIINVLKINKSEIYQDCQKILAQTLKNKNKNEKEKTEKERNEELKDVEYFEFIDLVTESFLRDQHFHPQYLIARDSKGKIAKFDEIIRMESPDVTPRILHWLNLMLKPEIIDQLPILNSTQHLTVDFKYQPETIVKINRLYQLDYLLFSYLKN